jgi:hypothetical protein
VTVLPSLATVADFAVILGRTFTPSQETQAQALLDQSSSVIRAFLRQDITYATTTDVFTMRRADPLRDRCSGVVTLPQRPVAAVTRVEVDGIQTHDWWLEGEELRVRGWNWGHPPAVHTPPQVTVTYTHGYDPVPADLAVIAMQAANRVMVNPSAIRSETVGGISTTYLIPGTGEALGVLLSKTEQKVLARYRRASGTIRLKSP